MLIRVVAVIQGIPGAQFVLETVAIVTVVGTWLAHQFHPRATSKRIGRAVASYAFITLLGTGALQLLLLVRSG